MCSHTLEMFCLSESLQQEKMSPMLIHSLWNLHTVTCSIHMGSLGHYTVFILGSRQDKVCLMSSSTGNRWLQTVNAKPGFNTSRSDMLGGKVLQWCVWQFIGIYPTPACAQCLDVNSIWILWSLSIHVFPSHLQGKRVCSIISPAEIMRWSNISELKICTGRGGSARCAQTTQNNTQKMKVQTCSQSVGKALHMAEEAGYLQLMDCSPTVGFIQVALEKVISTSTSQCCVNDN